ncbi:3226_t:CDS:10 [Acaulospora morrowiae]|uniref:Pre-rRNA-processing protein RIX1 n=1 Tax=Acaulospora morrowiae TaxID=94023 RepID=A0A9N9E2I1_9GLOM|nr:3226_t:CDS:10 [Acaulospora morrowiae]
MSTDPAKLLNSIIINYTFNDDTVESFVPFILETITHHQLLKNLNKESNSAERVPIHKWCTRINSLLQSKVGSARWAGVCFVKISIEQSEDLFAQNLKTWSSALLTLLTRPEPAITLRTVISSLSIMFERTVNKPETQREVTSQLLPRFNTALLQLSENKELLPSIFDALSCSGSHFPTIFRPVFENVQKLSLGVLDGTSDYGSHVVKSAVNCFASITNVGGKTSSMDHWQSSALRIVGSLNSLLDRLFDTVDEDKEASKKLPVFEFPPVADDYVNSFPTLFSRFQCLCECIISLISFPTTSPIRIPMNPILDVFCRVHNVSDDIKENKDKNEFITLMLGAPTLCFHSNKVLSSLIACFGEHLARNLGLISNIIMKQFRLSESRWLLRSSVYRLTSLCIQKYGFGFAHLISSSLITCIVEDIKINQEVQYLDVEANSEKKSGRKKKKLITNSDALVNMNNRVISYTNVDVQIASLEALKNLLTFYGSSIPANVRTSIDDIILTRILSSDEKNENDCDIRSMLYECLLASVLSPSVHQPTILPHALRVFSSALSAQSHKLRLFSSHALSICDLIFHSRLPPLKRSPASSTIQHIEKPVLPSASDMSDNENTLDISKNRVNIQDVSNDTTSILDKTTVDLNVDTSPFTHDDKPPDKDATVEKVANEIVHLPISVSTLVPEPPDNDNTDKNFNKKRTLLVDAEELTVEDRARVYKPFRTDDIDSEDEDMELPEIVSGGPDSDYASSIE